MRNRLLILVAGFAVTPTFAHTGLRVTSQQAVAVYGGAQGVLRYAGGGNAHENSWSRPVSHSIESGESVYLVAPANEVAMRGILAEVSVPGEHVLSGDARWEMFTINPGDSHIGTAPDAHTLFAWVNIADDARAWRFPDLSGTNAETSPEFLDGIRDSAARMSRRFAADISADLGDGAPKFVVCRLRFPNNPVGDQDRQSPHQQAARPGVGPAAAGGASGAPQAGGIPSGGGADGGAGPTAQRPGLLDPDLEDPTDPTHNTPLTGAADDASAVQPPAEPTPVIPTPPATPPSDLIASTPPVNPSDGPNVPPFELPSEAPTNPPSPPTPLTSPAPPPPAVPSPGTLLAAGFGITIAVLRRRR